ncbi:hypothetical protein Xcel_3032 [Xylanimonas cellulosilytica DSM 15894]|uniref:Thioredoxin domain-containing protein n=1 Tax=Xylanimonas cellulosilytica (strain DSM 15894 / JCM 12276 / CECT 5975 / KCTC 9989 / LMG 20990 / NBRC 107835 / XIL07) TaxID=446471 RepID=D1BZR0_XYLCX|nr:thioredoxin family protein [Xylanimonas cellulosilytica]ACZ32038.1 hypothetical protein Xcel_3032 [Xylanimonas cellulosilytica DSM 15894]
MPQLVALVALLAVTALVGGLWHARQGRIRVTAPGRGRGANESDATANLQPDTPQPGTPWAALGLTLGERATFLQLSAEVCSPCRATARVLTRVAATEDGVVHHELDVDQHLDLVKRLKVLTTPTVLVLDPDGVEIARASGAMSPAQAQQALALSH